MARTLDSAHSAMCLTFSTVALTSERDVTPCLASALSRLPLLIALLTFFVLEAQVSNAQVLQIREFPVSSEPTSITPGPDGGLWFTEQGLIGRMSTSGVLTAEHPTYYGGPASITVGSDGALWFTLTYYYAIGRMTTSGALVDYGLYDLSNCGGLCEPFGIAAGLDGALWFTTEYVIGRITTSGVPSYYQPLIYGPFGLITAGPDGALWFTLPDENSIGRITTSGSRTEYRVSTPYSFPFSITAGPDGALWFTELDTNKIGRISTAGDITEYPIPTPNSEPGGITTGPDNALWFTEVSGNKVGRITTSGVITGEYPVPTPAARPYQITVGSDGNLWFNELNRSNIGKVVLTSPSPAHYFTRPVPMGVSVSNTPDGITGTAGLLVHSRSDPNSHFILSNNHVLGSVAPTHCPNTAIPGQTWTLQPGVDDIGRDPGHDYFWRVGTVAGFLRLNRGSFNFIDAAIALTDLSQATGYIFGIGFPNPVVGSAEPGERVVKSGETTGVTVGTVTAINVKVPTVRYPGCGIYKFANQILIQGDDGRFDAEGDSGSVILDLATLTPVGLLFAGRGTLAVANPISTVYDELNVFPDAPPGSGSRSHSRETLSMEKPLEPDRDPRLFRLEELQARHDDELLGIPGVQAVGIGLAENGRDLAFHVYVIRMDPAQNLVIPREIEGVPVRILETGGEIWAL